MSFLSRIWGGIFSHISEIISFMLTCNGFMIVVFIFLFFYKFFYFIFGCVGSLLLHAGFSLVAVFK